MFIPPNHIPPTKKQQETEALIQLQSAHLLIRYDLAQKIFGKDYNVYTVYYPERNSLMVAPVSDELFKKLHKASQALLKEKNSRGDRTIALHDILLDHQIDPQDRSLAFDYQEGLGVLNIQL